MIGNNYTYGVMQHYISSFHCTRRLTNIPFIFAYLGEIHRRKDQFGQDHRTAGTGQQQTTKPYCYGDRKVSI